MKEETLLSICIDCGCIYGCILGKKRYCDECKFRQNCVFKMLEKRLDKLYYSNISHGLCPVCFSKLMSEKGKDVKYPAA